MADGHLSFADPNQVPSRLEEPAAYGFSVLTLNAGWPEDLERLVEALAATSPDRDYEIVAVANASPAVEAAIRDLADRGQPVRGLFLSQHVGFGPARNAGIRQARGRIIVVADTSIEPIGDALSPLTELLADAGVGMVGKWGLVSADLRNFEEVSTGEVDALQAYWMAFRRPAPDSDLLFDPKFKFYRNADIDFSLRWRAQGLRLVAADLPLTRHLHREWEALTADERERKSRDNFARLLRTWRDRTDLLISGGPR